MVFWPGGRRYILGMLIVFIVLSNLEEMKIRKTREVEDMAKKIAVIGAGPGGYVAAIRAAQLGAEVTVIERDKPGGTCLNWGCIPSKILKTSAELLENFHRAGEFGLSVEGRVRVNLEALMARKQKIVDLQGREILHLLAQKKVRYLEGTARLEGPHRLAVERPDGRAESVTWDGLILAPGSRPAGLPALPLDGRRIISSNEALSLQEIPQAVLIVGGGVIGCEFAFILAALGAEVTVVEALSRLLPLPSVDEDCSKIIGREMKKMRIKFMVNRVVERVEEAGGRLRVSIGPSPWAQDLKKKDLSPVEVEAGQVLVCVGRRPNTDNLGLESIGVRLDERGWIKADDRLAVNVPEVYAIGDVLGPERIMLAHVASAEGLTAAENLMGGNRVMDYSAVPGAIFTRPEVADVGLTEAQAREQGLDYRAETVNFRNIGKAQVIGQIVGQAKIISEAETGRVLGVHIIGPQATDLIAEGVLAVKTGCRVRDLAETIHAHPTLAEIMVETAYKALDRSVHG